MSLEQCLEGLKDEHRPLAQCHLAELSSLAPEEMAFFRKVWPRIGVERQRQAIAHLAELAERDCQLNFDDVFRFCLGDRDEQVRATSIEGLWECEHRALLDAFIYMLKEDSSEQVRAAAAMALGRFAVLAELEKLLPRDGARVRGALVAAIDNLKERLEVKRRAVEAISAMNVPRVKAIIQEAYESDDARMRASALYAMGRNGDPSWLPTLLKELQSPDAEMRYEAAVACGELGHEDAIPHLERLIHDVDSQVRFSAIAALGDIGGDEAEESLREFLDHPDDTIREAASEALEGIEVYKDPFSFGVE